MNARIPSLLTALTAFATGFLAGILFAPRSGRDTRRRVGQKAQASSRWVGDRLQHMEVQLSKLEQDLQVLSNQLGQTVSHTAQGAVEHFIPTLPDEETAWEIDREDVSRNLRHLPRK